MTPTEREALPPLQPNEDDLSKSHSQLRELDQLGYSGMRDNMVRMAICDLLDDFNCRERQLLAKMSLISTLELTLSNATKRIAKLEELVQVMHRSHRTYNCVFYNCNTCRWVEALPAPPPEPIPEEKK